MNHCVPDFEMEEDYTIPSSSRLNRSKKPSMQEPEDEIMELLWQNGQVVVQSQNQRSLKKPPPFKFHDADQPASREIRSSSYHHQQQQSVTDHLFMQEDEMASWLHYPLSDANFDHDFCADLLCPSSSTAVAPCATSTAPPPQPPLGRVSQVLVSASAMAPAPRPPIPPVRRNELESVRIQNFVNSKHRTTRAEQSGPSNSKSVARESTVVDSCDTPAVAPESGASQALPSGTEAASGGENNNACGNMSVAAATNTQSAGVSLGASKDNLATREVTVTSSPGASSASAEPTAEKPVQAEDRKRKGREPDDAECQSEDVDQFDPAARKKQSHGSTSTKRSRAAEVHNLSERRRRDRINEKMRALQELIPRCNKSDKASMLDEAIEYLKSLQLQVQMMSMGCGMVPMMFPGVQQYMPTMGMGIGMGMDMGINRPMMPFPNVLAGSGFPTPPSAAHLDPRFPIPAFNMSPQVPPPDPSRLQPSNQSDAMLNPLGIQNPNQPRIPIFADPYQQYISLHQMHLQPPQCQAMAQPSSSKPCTSKGPENLENHPSGDMTQ